MTKWKQTILTFIKKLFMHYFVIEVIFLPCNSQQIVNIFFFFVGKKQMTFSGCVKQKRISYFRIKFKMLDKNFCPFWNVGFCKFKDNCFVEHAPDDCGEKHCKNTKFHKRHRKQWKYFAKCKYLRQDVSTNS